MRCRLVVTISLCACTSSEPPPPEPVPQPQLVEAPPVGAPPAPLLDELPALPGPNGHTRVLLRDGARLYAAADRGSASAALRLAKRPDTPPDGVPRSGAVAIVGERGEFIEIDTDGPGAQIKEECAAAIDDLYVFSLRAFVRRDDLVPVLTRAVEVDLPRGTSARLSPGTAVWPRAGGAFAIDARGVTMTAALPLDAVGLAYTPTKPTPSFPIDRTVVDPGAALLVGDVAVGGRTWFYGRRPAPTATASSPVVRDQSPAPGGFLVELANRCAELTAFTDRPPIRDSSDENGNEAATDPELGYGSPRGLTADVGGLERTNTAWQVEADTEFTTLGGVRGRLRHANAFPGPPERVGETLCLAPQLGGVTQPELRLCFARDEVRPLAPISVHTRIDGAVDEAMVRRLIAGRARVLFKCDDIARKTRPQLAGKATLSFAATPGGKASRASVDISGLPGGAPFARCLADPKIEWLILRSTDKKPARVFYELEIGVRDPLPR